jgi:hypothetical protein
MAIANIELPLSFDESVVNGGRILSLGAKEQKHTIENSS